MCALKAKGNRSAKCFIQVCFAYLFQHIANAEGTIQISSAEGERNLGDVRGSFQGSLLHVMETDLPGAMKTKVLVVLGGPEPGALS